MIVFEGYEPLSPFLNQAYYTQRNIQLLPKRNDLTPLTDPTWIAKVLSDLPEAVSQGEGAKTGWRGLNVRREIAVLKKSAT